jgi:pimeloyl-ACP methyl ester carboxylesterase
MERISLANGPLVFPALAAGPSDGPLVLLLHGFPQTARAWSVQVETLGEAGWRAVAPDLRGFAASALPADPDAYDQERLRDDVFAIASQLGADRFHLVGHDLGGIIAWDVACRNPDRILSLSVASTPHLAAFAAALESHEEERLPPFELFRQPDVPERAMLADDGALLRAGYVGLDQSTTDEYVRHFAMPGILTGALDHFRAFDYSDWTALPPSRVPTLFVWGSNDPYLAPATAHATRDHAAAAYAEVELEGVGHWVPDLAAERVSHLLLEHLSGSHHGAVGP